jgi:hypothetical protein
VQGGAQRDKRSLLPPPAVPLSNVQQVASTRHQQHEQQHQQRVNPAEAGKLWAEQLRRRTAPDPDDLSLLAAMSHAKALATADRESSAVSHHALAPAGKWHSRFSAGAIVNSVSNHPTMSVSQQQLPQLSALRVAAGPAVLCNAGFSSSSSHVSSCKGRKPAGISRSAEFISGALRGKLPVLGHLPCNKQPVIDVVLPDTTARAAGRPKSS